MFRFINENKNALKFSAFQSVHALSLQVVVPFLSIILLESNWTTQQIAYFFAIFTFAGFLFSPVVGKISDEIGRKKLIILGLALQAFFFMVYFFSNNIYLIYFSRFLDGISFCFVSIVALSAFEDLIEKDRGFWTGLYLSVGTIGALSGPVIAGFVSDYYQTKILLIISAFFTLIALFILVLIPEKKRTRKQNIELSDFNPLSEIKDFIKFRKLQAMAALGMIMNARNQIYVIFFPIFVLTILNFPKHYLGFLLAIPVFFHIFQFYYGKIADKVSAEFGTMLGVFLVSFSMIILPYSNSLIFLIFVLVVLGIGGGIWNVNAWSLMGNIAKEKDMEGEVIGTYQSLSKLGVFVAMLFSAYLVDTFGITRTLQLFGVGIIILNSLAYFYFAPIFHHKKNKNMFHKILKS